MVENLLIDRIDGGAGYITHHRAFFADEGIEQRAFADIDPPDDGDSNLVALVLIYAIFLFDREYLFEAEIIIRFDMSG